MIKTSKEKIKDILNRFDIKQDSYLILHTSLFVLGQIEGGIKTIYDLIIKKYATEGTVIVPTFTYSFRRKQIFNVNNSVSDPEVGVFPEFLRNQKKSYRNLDPLFSFSSIGKDKDIILRQKKNCFSKNSIFEKLLSKNAKILSIGVEFTHGITEFMHIEKLANVFYRYERTFTGHIIDHNKKKFKDKAIHFVKNERIFKKYQSDRENFGQKLIKKGICKTLKYGYGNIFTIDTNNFLEFTYDALKKKPDVMLKKI